MTRAQAVLVDFGGTLFMDGRPHLDAYDERRADSLVAALPELEHELALAIVEDLERQSKTISEQEWQDTDLVLREVFGRLAPHVLPIDAAIVRAAVCVPMPLSLVLPGAAKFLAGIHTLGLRCVLVSNAYMHDGANYLMRLNELGLGQYLDGLVSSVDTHWRKPHPAIFKAAVAIAGCSADACVMVGDNERKDIAGAKALGMRTIRVAIQERRPDRSAADAVVTSLSEAGDILARWVR